MAGRTFLHLSAQQWRSLIWAFLPFAILFFGIWMVTGNEMRKSDLLEHGIRTDGWITDHRMKGGGGVYDYAFICDGDTVTGSESSSITLPDCAWGMKNCIGQRVSVLHAANDCGNNMLDLSRGTAP